jgi:hypothetical protein
VFLRYVCTHSFAIARVGPTVTPANCFCGTSLFRTRRRNFHAPPLNIGSAAFASLRVAPPAGAASNTNKTPARSFRCLRNSAKSDMEETYTRKAYSSRLQNICAPPRVFGSLVSDFSVIDTSGLDCVIADKLAERMAHRVYVELRGLRTTRR